MADPGVVDLDPDPTWKKGPHPAFVYTIASEYDTYILEAWATSFSLKSIIHKSMQK